jgi:WD40 repeat protein
VNATLRFGQPAAPAEEALHQAILSSQVRATLRGHADSVDGVAFSPDGKRLATPSGDGTVQVYALDIPELLNPAPSRVTRTFTAEECQRYFQSPSCPP